MFKLIIAGGRHFSDYELLSKSVDALVIELNDLNIFNIQIVSGGASGADTLGVEYANSRGYSVKRFPAKWNDFSEPCRIKCGRFGKYNALAGFNRNEQMAQYADGLLAFWDGESPGTKHMIDTASKNKLLIGVVKY